MDTLVGKTLSHYRIVEKIGAGGMGEVYRAHDSRLGRDVAIKALPEAFSSDPDRLARFEREAKVLASLNHPNVAGIYGIEEAGGHRYLALEFVEGETLASRIARGPLPIEEAIEICLQIATGMEAAHEGGIVHRDLKPGNVMITSGDQVKVVDFGLAKGKAADPEEISPDSPTVTDSPALHHSPTPGTPATLPGVILGTAAYLSPEQARGKAVDRRTDIWAFGCVFYECLTGRKAFEGQTVSDVIAAILSRDVDWPRLPRSTPPALRALLDRCFEKDPRKRLRDIGEARIALEEIREGKGAISEPRPSPRLLSARAVIVGAVVLLAGIAAGIGLWSRLGPGSRETATTGVKRFSVALPPEVRWGGSPDSKNFAFTLVAISPDGRSLITVGTPRTKPGEPAARPRLYRRSIDGDRFEPIEGSEGATGFLLSPDGRWLYFVVPVSERAADLRLVKVPTDGVTTPVTVTKWDPSWADWVSLENGDLLATTLDGSFVRIHSDGRPPSVPTKINMPPHADFGGFTREGLPEDRGILVNIGTDVNGDYKAGVGVFDPKTGNVKTLLREGANAVYARTGHLIFTRRSTLLAAPFDLERFALRGEPIAIASGLRSEIGVDYHASFSLSNDGTLVYLPGGIVGERRRLIVVDREGRVSDWSAERTFFAWSISAAPDGKHIACQIASTPGIWISERGRAESRRIFMPPGQYGVSWPQISFDGKQIAFTLYGDSADTGIYTMPLDGSAEARQVCRPTPPTWFGKIAWLGGGSSLLGSLVWSLPNLVDIVRVPISQPGESLSPLLPLIAAPNWREYRAVSSPDGRYIAYVSNETGKDEIYVVSYHVAGTVGAPHMASVGGGVDPKWGTDGKEVYYRSPQRRVMSVPVVREPILSLGQPAPCWDLDQLRVIEDGGTPYDLLPGGQMIAIQRGEDEGEVDRVEVVLNFFDELKEKVRAVEKH